MTIITKCRRCENLIQYDKLLCENCEKEHDWFAEECEKEKEADRNLDILLSLTK